MIKINEHTKELQRNEGYSLHSMRTQELYRQYGGEWLVGFHGSGRLIE